LTLLKMILKLRDWSSKTKPAFSSWAETQHMIPTGCGRFVNRPGGMRFKMKGGCI